MPKYQRGEVVVFRPKSDRKYAMRVRVVDIDREGAGEPWYYTVVFANGGNARMVAAESELTVV